MRRVPVSGMYFPTSAFPGVPLGQVPIHMLSHSLTSLEPNSNILTPISSVVWFETVTLTVVTWYPWNGVKGLCGFLDLRMLQSPM